MCNAELFAVDLRKMPSVEYAVRVSGVYEFFVKVNSDTEEEYNGDQDKQLGKVQFDTHDGKDPALSSHSILYS
jgi:hypothetical protein